MITTIDLLGKSWVTGLWWQCLSNQKTALKEAQALNMTLNLSLPEPYEGFVFLPGKFYQAGFASGATEANGALIKDPSLAAVLAKSFGETSVLLHIRSETHAYLFAMIQGVIMADGDMYGKKEDIAKHFEDFKELTWDQVINESFETYEEFENAFKDLLAEQKKYYRIQSPESASMTAYWIVLVALVMAGVIFAGSYHIFQKRKTKRSFKPSILSLKKPPELPPPPAYVTPTYIPISESYELCRKAFNAEELTVNGWALTQWACSGTGEVLQNWNSTPESKYMHLPTGAKLNAVDPTKLQVVLPAASLAQKSQINDSSALSTEQEIFSVLRKIAQNGKGDVQFVASTSASTAMASAAVKILLPTGSAKIISWTITTEISPFKILSPIRDFPGVGISKIAWDISSGKWKIQGDAYVQIP